MLDESKVLVYFWRLIPATSTFKQVSGYQWMPNNRPVLHEGFHDKHDNSFGCSSATLHIRQRRKKSNLRLAS
jgi:hypothetical protein